MALDAALRDGRLPAVPATVKMAGPAGSSARREVRFIQYKTHQYKVTDPTRDIMGVPAFQVVGLGLTYDPRTGKQWRPVWFALLPDGYERIAKPTRSGAGTRRNIAIS